MTDRPLAAPATGATGATGATVRNFGAVDLDVWARQFLAAFDLYLSPPYASAIYALGGPTAMAGPTAVSGPAGGPRPVSSGQALFEQLVAIKYQLADRIASGLLPVLAGPTGPAGLADAQEALRQQARVSLSAAYATNALVQPTFDVGGPVLPARLVGQPADLSAGATGPTGLNYTMSTSKLPVDGAATDLSFILDVRSAPDQAKVDFDLGFVINQMERGITAVPGVTGYEASSWLNFVRPPGLTGASAAVEVNTHVGPIEVPIPLRAYPTPPSLTDQGAGASHPGATGLAQARQWDLSFSFDYAPAAQDSLFTSVAFNLGGNPAMALKAEGSDLFDYLAEFITIYPDLAQVLSGLPAGNSGAAGISAVQRLAEVAGNIANTWRIYPAAQAGLETSPLNAAYRFDLQLANSKLSGIEVTVESAPDGPALAWPEIAIAAGATAIKLDAPVSPPPCVPRATALYSAPGGSIPIAGRATFTVTLPDLDAIHLYDAWAAVAVARNLVLITGSETDPHFVYQTPLIRFSNGVTPSIDQPGPFDVGAIVGSTGPAPLADWLSRLLCQLLEVPPEGPTLPGLSRAGVQCSYGFDLLPDGPGGVHFPVVTPVRLQPPFDVTAADLSPTGPTGFASQFAESVLDWADQHAPRTNSGSRLTFSVSLMPPGSTGTVAPTPPVVTLDNLRLDVSLISDFPTHATLHRSKP